MARPGIPVYVLGRSLKDIRIVTSSLSPDIGSISSDELNKVWIVHRSVKLRKGIIGYPIRVEPVEGCDSFKSYEHSTDITASCCKLTSRSRNAPRQAESQHMEYLKSVSDFSNSQLNDNGYASDDDSDKQTLEIHDIETDIHEIALTTKPKSELPSLILHRFIHAGIFVLVVDTEQFEQSMALYAKTLRELGTYSALTKAGYTELIVVNITEQNDKQKDATVICKYCHKRFLTPSEAFGHVTAGGFKTNARKLYNTIRKSYFGNHFTTCCITELGQKICEIVSKYEEKQVWPTREFTKQRSLTQTLGRKYTFIEIDKADNVSDLSALEQSDMFGFKVLDTGYIWCRPYKLVQKFLTLLESMETRNVLAHDMSVDDFTEDIDYDETNILLSALAKTRFIEEDDDIVYMLPLIAPGLLQQYDEKRPFTIATNVLRLAIDISVIPTVLMADIIMSCVHLGWVVKTTAPITCESSEAILLEKGSFGLVMAFDLGEKMSFIGLCIIQFQTGEKSDTKLDCSECEKLRTAVESAVASSTLMHNHKLESLKVCGQYIKSKDEKDVLKMNEGKWADITTLMNSSDNGCGVNGATLLSHWYPSKSKEIEETMNKSMSDDVLVRIAELFGRGYKIFFIGQKIPSSVVDRIGLENQNNVTYTVFQLLKEWVRLNGYRANLSALRTAITESSINIDLSRFDEIVKEYQ